MAPDKSRHIDTRYYFLRDMDRAHVTKLRKFPGTENVAGALTKSLPGPTFRKHVSLMMGAGREHLMARPVPDRHPSCPRSHLHSRRVAIYQCRVSSTLRWIRASTPGLSITRSFMLPLPEHKWEGIFNRCRLQPSQGESGASSTQPKVRAYAIQSVRAAAAIVQHFQGGSEDPYPDCSI